MLIWKTVFESIIITVKFYRQTVSSYTDEKEWDGSKDSSYFCSVIFQRSICEIGKDFVYLMLEIKKQLTNT